MVYSKKETYSFTIPQEYKYYIDFKRQLEESGIRFTETGGNTHQIIEIFINGVFEEGMLQTHY